MKKFFTRTRIGKLFGIAFFVMMNFFFYTLEAGGMGTGFSSAWDIHPIFGIFLSLVLGVPTLGWVYFFIMDI
jgi:hypothetical protein